MKIKYYGTAAAEGIPSMFGCNCETCKNTKKLGGRNIRTRSQATIDDKILIDFPADTYMHVINQGLNLDEITSCIITHNHSDHFYPADLEMRRVGFSTPKEDKPFVVYGANSAGISAKRAIDSVGLDKENRVFFKEIQPFEKLDIEGYSITPLKAAHDPKSTPVIYLIEHNGKTILYANDTGYFPDETWAYLEKNKPYIDYVSIDCSAGINFLRETHMCFEVNLEVKDRMDSIGCTDENSKYCLNHISHNGGATYDELVQVAEKVGFLVSFDGMEVFV